MTTTDDEIVEAMARAMAPKFAEENAYWCDGNAWMDCTAECQCKEACFDMARAALAVARPMIEAAAIERAAEIVEDGFRCRTCGTAFVQRQGHECEYPSWDTLDDEGKAAAIRALATPSSPEEKQS
jgi:hypothetical protein